MPEITMPEVKLPRVEVPRVDLPAVELPKVDWAEGLRNMTADDVARAMPEVRLPHVDIPRKVELPRVGLELPRKLELPRIEVRRKRSGPPWLLLAVLAAIAAGAWMLVTSPATGPRIRRWLDDVRYHAERLGQGMAGVRGEVERDVRDLPVSQRSDVEPIHYADGLPTEKTVPTEETVPADQGRLLTEGIGGESA